MEWSKSMRLCLHRYGFLRPFLIGVEVQRLKAGENYGVKRYSGGEEIEARRFRRNTSSTVDRHSMLLPGDKVLVEQFRICPTSTSMDQTAHYCFVRTHPAWTYR
jgi:hypothetical protein